MKHDYIQVLENLNNIASLISDSFFGHIDQFSKSCLLSRLRQTQHIRKYPVRTGVAGGKLAEPGVG